VRWSLPRSARSAPSVAELAPDILRTSRSFSNKTGIPHIVPLDYLLTAQRQPLPKSINPPIDQPISQEAKCQTGCLESSAIESAPPTKNSSNLIIEHYVPKDELRFLFSNSNWTTTWHGSVDHGSKPLLKMDRSGKHCEVLFEAMKALCLTFAQCSERNETGLC